MGGRDGNWPKIKVLHIADMLASWGGLGTKRVWEICENKNASVSQGCSSFRGASFIHCTDRDCVCFSASPFQFYENFFFRSYFDTGVDCF
jgi:hypothetical protein